MSWLLPALEPRFEAALRDVNAEGLEARVAAARRLGRPDGGRVDEARYGLRALLYDHAAQVRAAALESLSAIGTTEDHALARERLCDTDALVRELAVITLSSIDHPARPSALCEALAHPAPEVRFQALQACTSLFPAQVVAEAMALTRDSDAKVREAAIRALSAHNTDDAPARARLLAMLSDPAAGVRWEAAMALATHEAEEALPELLAALDVPQRRLDTLTGLTAYRSSSRARGAVRELSLSVLKSPLLVAAAGRALLHMDAREDALRALRRALRALRTEGRSHALQTVAEAELAELGPELARLSRWTFLFTTDLALLVQALSATAGRSEASWVALRRLARRRDALGRQAAAVLPPERPEPPQMNTQSGLRPRRRET